jgi:hypothetical protein
MRSPQLRPCRSPRFDGFAIGWSKRRDRKSNRPPETRPLIASDSAARKWLLPAQPCRPVPSRRRTAYHPTEPIQTGIANGRYRGKTGQSREITIILRYSSQTHRFDSRESNPGDGEPAPSKTTRFVSALVSALRNNDHKSAIFRFHNSIAYGLSFPRKQRILNDKYYYRPRSCADGLCRGAGRAIPEGRRPGSRNKAPLAAAKPASARSAGST